MTKIDNINTYLTSPKCLQFFIDLHKKEQQLNESLSNETVDSMFMQFINENKDELLKTSQMPLLLESESGSGTKSGNRADVLMGGDDDGFIDDEDEGDDDDPKDDDIDYLTNWDDRDDKFKCTSVSTKDDTYYIAVIDYLDGLCKAATDYKKDPPEKNIDIRHYRLLPLSFLDVSECTDLSAAFAFLNYPNLDLSRLDVSKCEKMRGMFYKANFNNDSILKWNIKNLKPQTHPTSHMFTGSTFQVPREKLKELWGDVTPKYTVRSAYRKTNSSVHSNIANKHNLKKQKEEMNEKYDMKYIDSRETFLNESRIGDFVKNVSSSMFGVVKKIFKKLKYDVLGLGGQIFAVAGSASAQLVAEHKIDNVKVYTNFNSGMDGVSNGEIVFGQQVADESMDEREKENLKRMVEFFSSKSTNESVMNEASISYRGEGSGIDRSENNIGTGKGFRNLTGEKFKNIIKSMLEHPELQYGNETNSKPPCIFGAPGIGKTTIPKKMLREFNKAVKSDNKRKAIIHIDCAHLDPEGFTLPLPSDRTFKDVLQALGKGDDDMEKLAGELGCSLSAKAERTVETAHVSWLPMYTTKYGTGSKMSKLLNDAANTYVDAKGNVSRDGGIIIFDEFLRAPGPVFNQLMNLINDRGMFGMEFGSKWAIMALSNRPCDDAAVESALSEGGGADVPALWNRFRICHFEPDYADWKQYVLNFGAKDFFPTVFFPFIEQRENGILSNWYYIEDRKGSNKELQGATPRSWLSFCGELKELLIEDGKELTDDGFIDYYKSGKDAMEEIQQAGYSNIGSVVTDKLMTYLATVKYVPDVHKMMTDKSYDKKFDVIVLTAAISTSLINRLNGQRPENEPSYDEYHNLYEYITKHSTINRSNFNVWSSMIKAISEGVKTNRYDISEYKNCVKFLNLVKATFTAPDGKDAL